MNTPYRPEEEGEPLVLTPANPAAGANFVVTVPANYVYRFVGGRFTFVTSAVVANRVVTIEYATAAPAIVGKWRRNTSHVASETKVYYFNSNNPTMETGIANDIYAPAWYCIQLSAGMLFQSNIILIDAGDQISNVQLEFLIWRVAP